MTKEKEFLGKIKSYVTLGTGNFMASAITALFWMYIATVLDKPEYGMLGYLMSIANVAHGISGAGLSGTIVVYGAKKENIYPAAFTLGLISSSLASVMVFVFTQNIGLSFLTWGMMMYLLKTADLNSKSLYTTFTKYRIARSSLTVVLGISLYHFLGIDGIILGFGLATLPAFGELYHYFKQKKFSVSILKPKINFMVTSWLFRLSNMLFWWGDKLIIGIIFGFSVLGSYQLAVQYLLLLDTIPRAITLYLLPQESQGKLNKKIKFFSIGVAGLIVIISVILIPYAIDTFFPLYHDSIIPAQIMSIAIIPITIFNIFEVQFFGKEMPRVIVIGSAIQTLSYFSLLVILGFEYGILGIAVAFLTSTIFRTIYNVIVHKIQK